MSDVDAGSGRRGDNPFHPAVIGLIAVVGILAFVGMLVLGAYAPDLRSGRNGGSHALSNGATGFSALVRLAEATGRRPEIVRDLSRLDDEEALVVATPERGADDLSDLLRRHEGKPILLVMPKWQTVGDPGHAGWIKTIGLRPPSDPERLLAPQHPLTVERHREAGKPLRTVPAEAPAEMRFTAPGALQTMSGKGLTPIVTDADGRIVIGQIDHGRTYVLADPDLIDNRAMADLHQAGAALALLDYLNATDARTILFDVTMNGLGRSKSPLKLAFDPPFLATTLALAAAILLAGLHGLFRFGAPRRPPRALAFGKAALVDNAAALVRKARRQAALGTRYAELVRQRAATAFGVPARLQGAAVDAYLDGLGGRPFSELAAAAADARDRDHLLGAAQALHDWQEEKLR
ncbi:MAG: hypothetical protein JO013_03820 [Alphaproteobacteria bacterium]|nr:hypothetical protein [Alphaproteobacteria bacterium]